jgi:hypothetical protein
LVKKTESKPRGGVLDGYLREHALAAELGRNVRTLARWRQQRIGPAFTLMGDTPIYSVDAVKRWLQAGGTAGASKPRRQTRRRHDHIAGSQHVA